MSRRLPIPTNISSSRCRRACTRSKFLRPGPIEVAPLAKSLSEWTTVAHRKNANHSLFFHAEELPPEINRSIEEADAFVADVAKNLSRKPQPYRGHPYWHGAMAAFHEVGGRKLNEEEWIYALGLPETPNKLTNWLLWHSKFALMGKPPHVLPWHPAWPDFQTVIREIDSFFTDPSQRMLLLSNEPTAFSVALADNGERTHRLRCRPFLKNPPERYERLHGKFDLCLLELSETDMEDGGELTDRIVPLLKNGGRIILFVLNRRVVDKGGEFGQSVTFQSSRFIRSSAVPTEIHFVPSNLARHWGRLGLPKLRRMMNRMLWLTAPLTAVCAGFLLLCSFIGNLDAWRATRRVAGRGHCRASSCGSPSMRPRSRRRMPIGALKWRARSARLWQIRQAACCPPSPRRRASRNTIAALNCAIRSG